MAETCGISWWAVRVGLGLSAAIILGVAGLYGFIQTQTGMNFLAERVGQALSDKSTIIRVSGLKGSVTSSFSVGKITVADQDGVYAAVDDTRFEWHPLALFHPAIDIETLSIGKLAIARLPRTGAASQPASVEDFASGFDIRAGKIEIGEVALGQQVLGEAQLLTATAAVSLDRDLSNAALDLTLRRIDGGKDKAEIKVDYAAHPGRFAAQVRVEERAGGVLARLAGLPRGDRLFIDLSGNGPPGNWKGALKLQSGSNLAVNTTLSLALRDATVGVSMVGTAKIDGLLPPELLPLVAPVARFRADADLVPSEGLSIRRFAAETDLLTLSGTGRYRSGDSHISAAMTGKLRNHPSLNALLPDISISRADFDVKLEGTLDAPRVSLQFQTDRVAGGPMQIASMMGSIALTPLSPNSFDLKGTLKASGFEPGKAVPSGIFGRTLDVAVAVKLKQDATLTDVTASAVSGPATAKLSGQLDRNGLADGSYSLRLDQIETLARPAGLALKGSFDAEGQFRADMPKRGIHLTTSGSFAGLRTPSPGLTMVLGERVPFAGAIEWREGRPLKIAGMKMDPAIGRLNVDGTVDTVTGKLSATLDLAAPDLKGLSTVAGLALAGKATVSAALDGPIGALTARGQALVTDLQIDQNEVGSIGIGYAARLEGATVNTRLRVNGILHEKTLDGGLTGRFGESSVDLSDIDVTVGKNRLAGKLGLDLTHMRLSGAVKATLDELGDLPGAVGLGLSGAGEISAATGAGSEKAIDFNAVGRDIRIGNGTAGGATIQKATARFRLRDPFTRATATGEIDLENFHVAGVRRGKAKIKISGNTSKIDWSTVASAASTYPVSLSANGALSLSAGQSRISVEKLEGKFAEQTIGLSAPFALAWRANEWRVDPLDFSLAGGRFRLAGSMAGGVLDAQGQFDNLPLRLATLIDPRFQMDGSVAGKFQASGAPQAPALTLSVAARDIRPPDTTKEEFAGFSLALDIRQESETASATGNLTGPDQTSATLSLKTRPFVSLSPISFSHEPDLPITGELAANGRLGLVDRLVGLGDDRIAGLISMGAKITGTLGKPTIHGDARLSGGSYEGAATGTLLRKIEGHVIFSGDSARLVSLTADDGATGRLSGTGIVQFAGAGTSSDGIEIKLDRFTALRHPLAEAVVTGGMTLSGSSEAPRIAGRMKVDKGDIRIPDKLPEQIIELEFVEINGQPANTANPPATREPSLAKTFPVSLDIALNIPHRTFVRGRGLDSEWKGDLIISGKTDAPIIKGKLEAIRGTFAFAGKTFVVKSGSVSFPNTASEPEIEAMAEAKLKDLVARVEISGSVSKPTIKISSDPVLPQEDVLAHILFGRTTGQLSALQAAQLAQTAATLSGKGGAGIMDNIRQALGVDVLNVESREGDSKGASLKAGKYLTEEIFLSVTQGTQPGSQKLGVEVQVLPNITVESDISGTADSNIGLNWKWDY